MTKTPRAQDDFYKHVNADWLAKASIPSDEVSYDNFRILRKQVANQVAGIIDEQTGSANPIAILVNLEKRSDYKQRLKSAIHQLDGIIKSQTAGEIALELGRLHARGLGAMWDIYIDVDDLDPSRQLLRTWQVGLSLGDKGRYTQASDKDIRSNYKSYLQTLSSMPELKDLLLQPKELWEFECELAKVSFSSVENRDLARLYNVRTLSDWSKQIDFPWDEYATGLGYEKSRRLCLDQQRVIEFVAEQLKHNSSAFKNHVILQVLQQLSSTVDGELYETTFEFFGKQLNGQQEPKPRAERRASLVTSCVPEIVGEQYMLSHFPSRARAEMKTLVSGVTQSFDDRLAKLQWLTEDDREKARKKLKGFQVQIGGPETPDTYKNIKLEVCQDLVEAKVACDSYLVARELAKADGPIVHDWRWAAPVVNASFNFGLAELTFPAGILQPPFFDFNATDAENYGAIGAVIGHELTHGFDDQGAQYDADRRRASWQSKKMRSEFKKRAAKYERLISKYEVLPGHYLRGKLVIGESIADLGGALIGYDAMVAKLRESGVSEKDICTEGFTHAQKFFISFAIVERAKSRPEFQKNMLNSDPHPESSFRVNGVLPHVDAFYEAFDVKEGDAMYLPPEERVRIW